RTANALECKITDGFDRYVFLNGHQDTGANQDLPRFGFIAKSRRNIRYRSDSGVVEAALKSNRAERGKSVRNANAEANVMPKLAPLLNQHTYSRSHFNRHQYGLEGGVIYGNGVIEHDHHPVTSVAFKRAAILVYDVTNRSMVFTQ